MSAVDRLPITPDDVAAAQRRLLGVANRTPVVTSRELDRRLGARMFLKAESLQRGGAFKFRGAFNKVSSLSERELARGVVASSSGNHAQALAIAAAIAGTQATIFMPEDAPVSKRAATEGYGARVIEFDRYRDDREAIVDALAEREGLTVVHPYDDPLIMAGAGTSTQELLDQAGPLDLVVIPAGGGGQLVLPAPGELTFAVIRALAEDVVGVEDAQMLAAMRMLFERQKLVVEPSGSTALAAVLSGRIDVRGLRVGVILSGGNIAVDRFLQLMAADPS